MAYTQTDLDNVQSAITALLLNQRRASCTINGNRMDFVPVQLPQLRILRSEIQSELATAAGSSSFFLASTSKGV